MNDMHLNIVSFDIPYPPDYGGIMDVYYKIKMLHENGVKVILHCFQYHGKEKSPELEQLCEQVYYYSRTTSIWAALSLRPYTVYGRKNKDLIHNLLQNDYPILFEGLVSTYYLDDKRLEGRVKVFRESNIEHFYYRGLGRATKSVWKKMFFYLEALKLRCFEPAVRHADLILPVSVNDLRHFRSKYPNVPSHLIPPFHPDNAVQSLPGQGDYILYHGNLAVPENEYAVLFLCQHVFPQLPYRCIVAGRNPTEPLQQAIQNLDNVELIANPAEEKMQCLVKQAQVSLAITFQNTGFKLKLLHTLFSGRYIVANRLMTNGSMLENLCTLADTPEEIIAACRKLMSQPFTRQEMQQREAKLFPMFSNQQQVQLLLQLIQDCRQAK